MFFSRDETMPAVLGHAAKQALIAETFSKQQADGGWTLQHAGVTPTNAGFGKAIAWLRAHQDAATGARPAVSMNKQYPDGSMMSLFMQDAATAFASIVLVEADAAPTR